MRSRLYASLNGTSMEHSLVQTNDEMMNSNDY